MCFLWVIFHMSPLWGLGDMVIPYSINISPRWGLWTVVILYSIHMSRLWGFVGYGYPVFYKHIAPLGLKATCLAHVL